MEATYAPTYSGKYKCMNKFPYSDLQYIHVTLVAFLPILKQLPSGNYFRNENTCLYHAAVTYI